MTAPAIQWYLARGGQQYGPLSEAELAEFIELGHLQPNDLLWREAGLKEVFVTAYGESAKTFPARFPLLSLDRIYVRNASVHLPVVLPRRPWSHLSDHAPLAAEIEL